MQDLGRRCRRGRRLGTEDDWRDAAWIGRTMSTIAATRRRSRSRRDIGRVRLGRVVNAAKPDALRAILATLQVAPL